MDGEEVDLDILTALLAEDDDTEEGACPPPDAPPSVADTQQDPFDGYDFDDDTEVEAQAGRLEQEALTDTSSANDEANNVSAATLGLEMSDDEADDNITNEKPADKPSLLFSAAFSKLKYKPASPNISNIVSANNTKSVSAKSTKSVSAKNTKSVCASPKTVKSTSEEIDPLELELRKMTDRMNAIKAELSKKKNLTKPDGSARKFTMLTHCQTKVTEQTKQLTSEDKQRLLQRLKDNKCSLIHGGETDSEDDEDNRNPFEARYNSYGLDLKKKLNGEDCNNSHSYSSRNKFTDSVGGSSSSTGGSTNSSKQSPARPGPRSGGLSQSSLLAEKRQQVLAKLKSSTEGGWTGVSGSLVAVAGTPAAAPSVADRNAVREPHTGIYIVNPAVSPGIMQERMEGRRHICLPTIPLHVRGGEVEGGDWFTIAVLVAKGQPKTSQKGSQYSIWQLSDLKDCGKTVGLFLFASAHTQLWKTTVGSVLGVLNAQVMKDRQGEASSNLVTMSVNNAMSVMLMGTARDLSWCKGRTKAGGACRQFVNKSVCEFCMYHVQREYQKTSSKRADLQSSFSRSGPKSGTLQQKVLGKEQVFYGGQLYGGGAGGVGGPVMSARQNTTQTKKDFSTLSSLKLKLKSQELKEEDRKKSFVLKHLTNREISAVRDLVKDNDALGDRLMTPTFGARNLLRHMTREDEQQQRKVKEAQGLAVSFSAKDLLKMQHQEGMVRKKQQQQRLSSQAPPRRSLSSVPQLGRGFLPGQDIELEISPQQKKSFDPVKAKALAILKRKGETLKTPDKNFVRTKDKVSNPEFQEKVQKRLRESTAEGNSDVENDGSSSKRSKTEGRSSMLGNVNLNKDKIQAMLEKRSRHTNLIEAEEDALMDKYYMNLEKKEMMEEKMASIMAVPISAVSCKICSYQSAMQSQYCKDQGHVVKSCKAVKRFFECSNCKRRTVSLDKMPVKNCSNCDKCSWKRVAMAKPKKGPTLESEVLCLRGNEQQHYSGTAEKAYLNID